VAVGLTRLSGLDDFVTDSLPTDAEATGELPDLSSPPLRGDRPPPALGGRSATLKAIVVRGSAFSCR